MGFEYSCFVSYRQGRKRLMTRFTDQLVCALEDYIEPYIDLPIFHDRGALEGGDLYNDRFSYALSRSVCMIAVYTPTYFDKEKSYCTREFLGMENLEQYRFSLIENAKLRQRGLIIPLILKGTPPEYIMQKRACKYDFSRFTLRSDDISQHEQYAEWFDEIGKIIRTIHDDFINEVDERSLDLDGFALPSEAEVQPFLDKVLRVYPQPFPGRFRLSASQEASNGF